MFVCNTTNLNLLQSRLCLCAICYTKPRLRPSPRLPPPGWWMGRWRRRSTHAFIAHADNLPKMLECIHFGLHTLTERNYQRWFVFNETSCCDLYLSCHPSPFLNVHTSGWVWTISRKGLLEKLSVVSPSLFNIKSLIVQQKINRRWFPMLLQGPAVCIFN